MLKMKFNFQRIEKKYLIDKDTSDKLFEIIKDNVKEDVYGTYSICNVYYDTENFALIRESIEKPAFKEKLRLRSYGIPKEGDTVFVEIKRKASGIVYKRRVALPYAQAIHYLKGQMTEQKNQIFKEIDYFMNFYKPVAKLFLAYDRKAFTGTKEKDLRITFDTNIRYRIDNVELSKGDYGYNLLGSNQILMEIKCPMTLPYWLANALNEQKIYPVSFSKYGKIYEKLTNEKNNIKSKEVI